MQFCSMLLYLALLLFLGRSVHCDSSCACGRQISNSFLDVAADMIQKAKLNMPTCSDECEIQNIPQHPTDCSDVLRMGNNKSGIYSIRPISRLTEDKELNVYCDMDTDGGGWTVIQRRGNFGSPSDYFFRDWKSYKEGFGDINKDFWLGNDNIFALTNQRLYSVRFDLQDVELEKRYAVYDSFWIDEEINNYTLHIKNYSGDAGDSMLYHDEQQFTTKDRKNDKSTRRANCADYHKGAWWYLSCFQANLNGLYVRGKQSGTQYVTWNTFKGDEECLEWTEIKIRPRKFRRN